jgi:hypothetical protein
MTEFAKVTSGDPLRIGATTWNTLLEAATAERARRQLLDFGATDAYHQGTIVRFRNDSGAALSRGAVLGIGGPVFAPGTDLEAFRREVVLAGITPTSASVGKFLVLVEPAGIGGFAHAAAGGVVACRVQVTAGHKCCDVAAGNTANLVSLATGGSAQILWAAGTGLQWAIVRIGNRCIP